MANSPIPKKSKNRNSEKLKNPALKKRRITIHRYYFLFFKINGLGLVIKKVIVKIIRGIVSTELAVLSAIFCR